MTKQHSWTDAAKAAAIGLVLAVAPLVYAYTITQITDNATNDYDPKISGSNVVWWSHDGNDGEIYLWDGSTTTQITDNASSDKRPAISGNNVVWYGDDGSDYEIYLWDGSATTQITDNAMSDAAPTIWGSNIVWEGWDGGDTEIYFTTVPEPTTLSLLAAGTLLACLKRRRCH